MTTANKVMEPCSDGFCILRDRTKPRAGMHTNGGCQHLQLPPQETRVLLRSMAMELDAMRRLPVVSECCACAAFTPSVARSTCGRLDKEVQAFQVPPQECPLRGRK